MAKFSPVLAWMLSLVPTLSLQATGRYLEVAYPPSAGLHELKLAVTYKIWLPEGVKVLRGVIVHQHGCGLGSCEQAVTAAADLHWQALAKKWDCALLAPVYQQTEGTLEGCLPWKDPRNGSDQAFLRALDDLGRLADHPELNRIPWCLWGHSGGGFWASLMQVMHPDRIVAIWFRSGTAFEHWEKGRTPKPEIPAAALQIPMMCNPGQKENDGKSDTAWTGTLAMFHAYRAKGAPIGFAPDPHTGHEVGDSRYIAIPFFDACLAARLPAPGSRSALRPVDPARAWLAARVGDEPVPAGKFQGNVQEAVWLPNEAFARVWTEFVNTGKRRDPTPPPAPFQAHVTPVANGVEVTWNAEADFESGLQGFIVQRDGKDLLRLPEKNTGKYGSPLFQGMTFGDTPLLPLAEMRYLDTSARPGEHHAYSIMAVNGAGLKSTPTPAR